MKLYALFFQPEESYEGQYAPIVLEVLDEYTVDNMGVDIKIAKRQTEARLTREGDINPDRDRYAWFEIELGLVEPEIRKVLMRIATPLTGKVVMPVASTGDRLGTHGITVVEGRVPGKIVDDEIME
jgi:hypothetical protein